MPLGAVPLQKALSRLPPGIRRFTPVAALIFLCCLVYANSLQGAFFVDDIPLLRSLPGARMLDYWANPEEMLDLLNFRLAGVQPLVYHLTNIALHLANTLLVLFLLRRLFLPLPALLAAAIFAVHPVHIEAVTWISGRGHMINVFGTLACLLAYDAAVTAGSRGGRQYHFGRYIVSFALYGYFMINHHHYLWLFPLLLVASDMVFQRARRTWVLWIPFFSLLFVRVLLARYEVLTRIYTFTHLSGGELEVTNPLLNVGKSLFANGALLVWPSSLTFYHRLPVDSPQVAVMKVIAVCLAVCFLPVMYRRARPLFLGSVLFVLPLMPTFSPLLVATTVAERYLYLPVLSLGIVAAVLYQRAASTSRMAGRLGLTLLLLVVALYSWRTVQRNSEWVDPAKFWGNALRDNPHSSFILTNLGMSLLDRGEYSKAIEALEEAIAVQPRNVAASINLGIAYSALDRPTEAVAALQTAVSLDPANAEAYVNLGNAEAKRGQSEQALAAYQKARQISPHLFAAYFNAGVVLYDFGRTDEAAAMLLKARALGPRDARVFERLGHLYRTTGADEKLRELYRAAVAEDVDYFEAYGVLGDEAAAAGDNRKAVRLYARAVRINPYSDGALAALGTTYLTVGNIEEAIRASEKALRLNPGNGAAHNTLAAAYYMQRRYDRAVREYDEALASGHPVSERLAELLKPYKK